MSNIVAQYVPKVIPKSYKTTEMHYNIVKNKDGTSRLEAKEVESTGGLLFQFPRGHSIRLSTAEQIEHFGLSRNPRLVDLTTGEEVDQNGVPLSIKDVVRGVENHGGDFGEASADE